MSRFDGDMTIVDELSKNSWDVGSCALFAVIGVAFFDRYAVSYVDKQTNKEVHATRIHSFVHVVQKFAKHQVCTDQFRFLLAKFLLL